MSHDPFDPVAYERAKAARIAVNARKGRAKRWHEAHPVDAARAEAFLWEHGEFAPTEGREANGGSYQISHPFVKASYGDFFFKMRDALHEWGSLTDGQMKAVLGMIDRAATRIEERAAAKAERAANAAHIGTVGERREFTLKIGKVMSFQTQFGFMFIHLMDDAETGNPVVYKGSKELGEAGETITVKATIKAHDVRDGVAQTVITRPM